MKKIIVIALAIVPVVFSCKKEYNGGDSPIVVSTACPETKIIGIQFEGYPVEGKADSLKDILSIPGVKLYAPILGSDLNQRFTDTTTTVYVYLVSLPVRIGTTEYHMKEIKDTLSAVGIRNGGVAFVPITLSSAIKVFKKNSPIIKNQNRLIACLGDNGIGSTKGKIYNFVFQSSLSSPYVHVNAVDTAAGVTYGNQILVMRKK